MDFLEFSNKPAKKENIEYFTQLVRIAFADNVITEDELQFLTRIGERMGFTQTEIEILIKTSIKSGYIPPFELYKRFEQLYNIVKLMMVDGVIDKKELHLASFFAENAGFRQNEISNLLALLIDGVAKGIDEHNLFDAYKKQRINFLSDKQFPLN